MGKTAILLTCYNKSDITLKCLSLLFSIVDDKFDVYLVDDGSTDGTAERVSHFYPNVVIIQGDGNLFWTRGMALAWRNAAKFDYDFYIWLNNDVYLFNNSFKELFSTSKLFQDKAIVSGIVVSQEGITLYGGYDAYKKLIQPTGKANEITYLNGNFVLIPKYVYQCVGNFDTKYHHDLGDVDYGLTAKKLNIPVVTTRVAIARGETNSICRERMNNTTLLKRFEKLYSPLGSPPSINFHFRMKHKSVFNAVSYFVFQHLINIMPDSVNKAVFGDKYT
ncbi:GT2 family glycosyltransferase [Algoriphagus sp. 4150]|uniref:glycosyltransferase family 2 protein n=1 Tax=Algoriphagus sp. 4150 TaxID=2817756 RepID=UPI002857636C|nr:glycosyltransferase family 2 protein [Algoriphagus sp. 4150]MDR7127776.1 GT2 family glycosyltransferase [Algoriphagus sp. 4150]